MAPAAATMTTTVSTPPANEKQLLELIEELTTNVHAVQERVLAEILGRNADSEYLAVRCGLAGATDRSTFRAKVPMVTYEDVKPYVMRVVNGDGSPILTGSAHPVTEFFLSSGTSGGEPKLIPVVKDNHDRDSLMESLAMAVMRRSQVSGLDKGRSALCFYFVRPTTMTPAGLPVHSATTSVFKHKVSKELASYDPSHSRDTSPPGAILCEDVFQSTYAQMLCGLCHRHAVLRIGTLFASGVVRAITFLQLHWRQLAADIEAGTLSQCITDQSVRDAVAAAAVLRAPDPELAQFIRTECGKGDWAGIIMRIWPNTKFIDTIVTGSMAQYVPTLNYYSAGAPIASPKYVSSECCFGINLRPMCDPSEVSYTILPNMAYFEFLPVDAAAAAAEDATARDLVDLAGVEAGREYEVVVTTYNGLNRYRVGDVLRVTGFHNAAPQFRFVGRKNVLLSLDADKTGEAELQHAVERAASTVLNPLGAAVLDYTSRACTESIPGHYVIYWELRWFAAAVDDGGPQTTTTTTHQSMSMDGDVLARCCLEMEEALTYVYREHRVVDGSIGPLEIRVVRSATFQELAEHSVSHGAASMAQYKVPRCVTNNPAIIRLLDSRVVSSHSSPSLPHWTPDRPKL